MIHHAGAGAGGWPAARARRGGAPSRGRSITPAARPVLFHCSSSSRDRPPKAAAASAADTAYADGAPGAPSRRRPPVVIVGGGLAGLSAAVALRRSGVEDVLVLESAPGPRAEGGGLSLWANAWRALDALGPAVAAQVRAAAGPPLREIEFASASGRVLRRFTVREATLAPGDAPAAAAAGGGGAASLDEFRGVRRAELLAALLGALPEGTVRYGVRGEVVAAGGAGAGGAGAAGAAGTTTTAALPRVRLVPTSPPPPGDRGALAAGSGSGGGGGAGRREEEQEDELITARCVVGADSARSGVAADYLALPPPRYNGYVAWRGIAATGQQGSGGASDTDIPPVRLALGAGVRAGVYPLGRGETYWFITKNAPEAEAPPARGDQAALRAQALAALDGWGWGGMRALVEATPLEGLSRARIADRWTLPWASGGGGGAGGDADDGADGGRGVGRGRVTLVGDAQHPMSPNLGQGGCTALEDAPVLAAALARAFQIEDEQEETARDKASGPAPAASAAVSASASASAAAAAGAQKGDVVARALRLYERERLARTLPLTLRAAAVGFALQLPYPPVVALRDAVIERVFRPAGFLKHTRYDCRAAAARLAREVR